MVMSSRPVVGEKPATIDDVARAAGVSRFTVSAVLNGARSNTRVSETTRQRIMDSATDLRYRPNAQARSLALRRTRTIGVLFDLIESTAAIENSYAAGVLQGIVREARGVHNDVLIYTEPKSHDGLPGTDFRDQRTDGVIVVAPLLGSLVVERVMEARIPVCIISSNHALDLPISRVDADNVQGVRSVVTHLLDLGHRRIAHITGREGVPSTMLRREIFQSALAEVGISVPPAYIVGSPYDGFPVQDTLPALMALPEPPTAIFAFNDDVALAVLGTARSLRISIPEQLSVVGFDDIPTASHSVPRLTTVWQPLKEMGAAAVRRLLEQIDGKQEIGDESLPTTLVVRESTGPPPSVLESEEGPDFVLADVISVNSQKGLQ